jgi:hypothetical protein
MSIAARHREQTSKAKAPADSQKTGGSLKKSVTVSDKKAGKRKEALDQAFGAGNGGRAGPSSAPLAGTRRVDDKAPSLNVDIRNSLMMPGYAVYSWCIRDMLMIQTLAAILRTLAEIINRARDFFKVTSCFSKSSGGWSIAHVGRGGTALCGNEG